MSFENVQEAIAQMRREAKVLREDELVNMVEGMMNIHLANKLDHYADKLEQAIKETNLEKF